LVLRGQEVSDGGALYAPWRPVVRHLCLFGTLSDEDAHILKLLVPDIAELIGRTLPDTPVTPNPQLARELLLRAITTLFEQQTRPIVVMLEDLHWANESVDVIVQLQAITANHPLLIIGAYRDDESPDLPRNINGAQMMKLQRLDKSAIADLSEAILGETGKMSHVVDFLADQTEGNVFFIVEVVRALAEEAGQLTRIGASTLPTQVFTGGVERIVRRRLSRVPEHARTLLASAAVLGRQLDTNVLQMLNEGRDLTAWLSACESAAVIEVKDGNWCFAHDKLREAALSDLSAATKRDLHRQIAQSLARTYGERADYLPAKFCTRRSWRAIKRFKAARIEPRAVISSTH
jgi:predicted ATPase